MAISTRFLVKGEDRRGPWPCSSSTSAPALRSRRPQPDGYEETIYGLEGALTWTVEGIPTDVGPGEALCIPRGAVHQLENTGDLDAKALAIVTPGILGPDYFRDVAAVLDAAAGGPPDLAAIGAVMRRHGLTPRTLTHSTSVSRGLSDASFTRSPPNAYRGARAHALRAVCVEPEDDWILDLGGLLAAKAMRPFSRAAARDPRDP
jgi:hypothetical protein